MEYLLSLPAAQASSGQHFSPATKSSGGPICFAPTVITVSSSEAPKEHHVVAQTEVVGFVAELGQTAAAQPQRAYAPSSPRASTLGLLFLQFDPNPTQPLQNGPNSAQPSLLALGPTIQTQIAGLKPTKSYLSAAQKTVPPEPFSYGTISLSGSIPEVLFSPPKFSKMSEDLKYALIGKFSFGKLSNEAIRSNLSLLGFSGCKILFLQANHVLIKVDDPNTSTKLWLKREISILNFPMRVFKWSADFDFTKEPPIVPVWIKIPALPLHCFDLKALRTIANIFGTLLKVDDATLKKLGSNMLVFA
ncbi:aspartyl/glutamyl-tRNA(Asn/Gln) amidotransferasesubunit B [Striga asiatica]|uniref:Aspartyl/glutamyl-tRNA(Asn/Gln) amidotransferasesubunit B n=1 Tax=Striga asiatica TaxID=4170 RepID=A0A5A7PV97_STRAF|nr:aspartyl/glutamyl-tRNA(Asn/Gln) amidotransferasesubunit B [Striga asiatica]